MLLLPFDKYTIETNKTREEIVRELGYYTNSGTIFTFLKARPRFFNGQIYYNTFKIGKNIYGRYSFLPIINGEIEENNMGCKVFIKVRTAGYTIPFFIICLGYVFLGIVLGIYDWLSNGVFNGFFIAFETFFIFCYFFMMLIHKIPAKECKDMLYKIIR